MKEVTTDRTGRRLNSQVFNILEGYIPACSLPAPLYSLRAEVLLTEINKKLLELIDRVDLTEEEKIRELRTLCQDRGADINVSGGGLGSVLLKATKTGSPALVKAVLDLGANLYKFWKDESADFLSPLWLEVPLRYDILITLLKHSVNFDGSIFDIPLNLFMRQCHTRRDQSDQVSQFEIIKLFLLRGASLSLKFSAEHAGEVLVRKMIHERGAIDQVCDALEHITSVKQRLDSLCFLREISAKYARSPKPSHYSDSVNLLKFINILDTQILVIKQIRTVSRLLTQGFSQESSTINSLNPDVLFKIAINSTQQPKAFPERFAEKIACTFFARPQTAYSDGHIPEPPVLKGGEKIGSDDNKPSTVTFKLNNS